MLIATLISLFIALICIAYGRSEENAFTERENALVCTYEELIVYPRDPWDVHSCINTCNLNSMCQAYRLPDVDKETRCELYFVNMDSQANKFANCNKRDTVYVRNQKLDMQNGLHENAFTARENALVCTKEELIVYPRVPWDVQSCIKTCKLNSMCQAYRLLDVDEETICELYFVNMDSQDSKKANCNERDTVYVRNQKIGIQVQPDKKLFTKRENVPVCLKMKFIAYPNDPWDAKSCINTCKDNNQCQAFKLPDTSKRTKCELYVFTKCSEDINRARCSDRATIYVRNQRGLPPGQLCPANFGSPYKFGSSKYLLQKLDDASWQKGAEFCGSQPGLSKYADASSAEETAYLHSILAKLTDHKSVHIGGYLPKTFSGYGDWPNRAQNLRDGWQWLSCKTEVKQNLWAASSPNKLIQSRYIQLWPDMSPGLENFSDRMDYVINVLCECVDPF